MNTMDRLGWSLLHFLWQGTFIVALYAVARRALRFSTPNARYLLACAALAAMALAPIVTWTMLQPAAAVPVATGHAAVHPSAVSVGAFASTLAAVPLAPQEQFLPWVVAVWFAGAMAFWVRLAGGWIFAVRLRTVLARPAPDEWQHVLDRLKSQLGVAVPVRLLVSAFVPAPTVVGWLRPVVLVPLGALTGLPAGQIEALLVHELAHIRRADYLVNLLQGVVEALLFYHPAVWWISGHLRKEREMCCDDVAVSVCDDVLTYALALAELESSRLTVAMAASGGSLAERIARLLGESRPAPKGVSGPAVAGVLLVAIKAFAVLAQPAARPQFAVASVKPSTDPGFQRVRPLPGRLSADASVRMLMQNAYGKQPFQIVNAPDWRYAIEAKADGDAAPAQLFLMLQSLLEERFDLKFHHESRELPVYALTSVRGGPKLPAPKEGACLAVNPADAPTEWAGGRMHPPGDGPLPKFRCGSVGIALQPSGARMQGGNVLMPELVRTLSLALGRVVIDKTGFTAPFDVQLDFITDATTSAMPPPPPGAAIDPNVPSIGTALQEQLGLRLDSTKGPVDVIVIDHIERPTAN
jgi:uncharacterized protein (TIGR03435 family)